MHDNHTMTDVCPISASFLDQDAAVILQEACGRGEVALLLAAREISSAGRAPFFLPDLCVLELAMGRATRQTVVRPGQDEGLVVNPSLEILSLGTSGCVGLATGENRAISPVPGEEMVLVWKPLGSVHPMAAVAGPEELAALKVVAEGVDFSRAETEAGVPAGLLDKLIRKALDKGILISPPSRIVRDPLEWTCTPAPPEDQLRADVFTLQWHITQACDLHCRHCYDRSPRVNMSKEQAFRVVEDFAAFCRERNVRGQISFSGGNPLLYPFFFEVYEHAIIAGLSVAILGNPTDRRTMERILTIAHPEYFQVSLEGLPEHNDAIRGSGHFQRVMDFLEILRVLDIQGQVMLTLTRDNMAEVLPLAERLEGKVWGLAFNRLSPVGRGAALSLPEPEEFQRFVADYCAATSRLKVLSFKDNMLNVHLVRTDRPTFGGCTGFGCGAAFNFMALLPDGEVHACRKFPSLIGRYPAQSLGTAYDGTRAAAYRRRSKACRDCAIVAVCGGCPAVMSGFGLDLSKDRDPFCPGPVL